MDIVQEIDNDFDKGALRLFVECQKSLNAEAMKLCAGNFADAEDLTVRTFDRAIRKLSSYDESKGRIIDWMRAIMRNMRKNDLERKAANALVAMDSADLEAVSRDSDNSTVDEILSKSDDEFLRRAVNSLPKELREAVIMHYLLDIPISKIAAVLRVPAGTVKARLHYARKALQGKLAAEMKKPRALVLLFLFLFSAATYAAWSLGLFGGGGGEGAGGPEGIPAEVSAMEAVAPLASAVPGGSSPTNKTLRAGEVQDDGSKTNSGFSMSFK